MERCDSLRTVTTSFLVVRRPLPLRCACFRLSLQARRRPGARGFVCSHPHAAFGWSRRASQVPGEQLHRMRGSPSARNGAYPDKDALRALARFGTGVAARIEPTRWGIWAGEPCGLIIGDSAAWSAACRSERGSRL